MTLIILIKINLLLQNLQKLIELFSSIGIGIVSISAQKDYFEK